MSEALDLIKLKTELTAKEKLAWLGSTLYYGQCLAAINFLLNKKTEVSIIEFAVILAASITVFIGAIVFINLQFRMRWQANDTTAAVNKVLEAYGPNYTVRNYVQDLRKYTETCKRKRCKSQVLIVSLFWPVLFWRLRKMPFEYRSEIPSYGIAIYLLMAEIAVCISRMLK